MPRASARVVEGSTKISAAVTRHQGLPLRTFAEKGDFFVQTFRARQLLPRLLQRAMPMIRKMGVNAVHGPHQNVNSFVVAQAANEEQQWPTGVAAAQAVGFQLAAGGSPESAPGRCRSGSADILPHALQEDG